MRIKLLDRILLAGVRWRLARLRRTRDHADKFTTELARVLLAESEREDRESQRAQQAAAERARYTDAIARFKSFEETQPRLQ